MLTTDTATTLLLAVKTHRLPNLGANTKKDSSSKPVYDGLSQISKFGLEDFHKEVNLIAADRIDISIAESLSSSSRVSPYLKELVADESLSDELNTAFSAQTPLDIKKASRFGLAFLIRKKLENEEKNYFAEIFDLLKKQSSSDDPKAILFFSFLALKLKSDTLKSSLDTALESFTQRPKVFSLVRKQIEAFTRAQKSPTELAQLSVDLIKVSSIFDDENLFEKYLEAHKEFLPESLALVAEFKNENTDFELSNDALEKLTEKQSLKSVESVLSWLKINNGSSANLSKFAQRLALSLRRLLKQVPKDKQANLIKAAQIFLKKVSTSSLNKKDEDAFIAKFDLKKFTSLFKEKSSTAFTPKVLGSSEDQARSILIDLAIENFEGDDLAQVLKAVPFYAKAKFDQSLLSDQKQLLSQFDKTLPNGLGLLKDDANLPANKLGAIFTAVKNSAFRNKEWPVNLAMFRV